MSKEEPWHQTKEVVSRLKEPIKIKFVPYITQKERGHQIQLEVNMGWDQVDSMCDPTKEIAQIIANGIKLIEGPMKSVYLGVYKE